MSLTPDTTAPDSHAPGVSLALNAGVPAIEVARRAGHSVVVLLKIYAHCIGGQADAANKRIADALGATKAKMTMTSKLDVCARQSGEGAAPAPAEHARLAQVRPRHRSQPAFQPVGFYLWWAAYSF